MKLIVYALVDPCTKKTRYVGITKRSLSERLKGHVAKPTKNVKPWIDALAKRNMIPCIEVLQETTHDAEEHPYKTERFWIQKMISNGQPLLNRAKTTGEQSPLTMAIQPRDDERPKRARALRKALGLSQEKLGISSGLGRIVVNKIENGRNLISLVTTRDAVAKGFGMSVDDLESVLSGAMAPEAAARRVRRRAAAAGEGVAK